MTINEVIYSPKHPFFNAELNDGNVTTSNEYSYYRNIPDVKGLTFDVSNQKTLANLDVCGTIQTLTFYRENLLTEEKPGVWVNKQLSQTNSLSLKVEVNGIVYHLSESDHRIEVDVIQDCLPRYIHHYSTFKVIVVSFAPILANKRLSMLVQQVYIVNETHESLQVSVKDVPSYQEKYSDQQNVLISQKGNKDTIAQQEVASFAIAFVDPNAFEEVMTFQESDIEKWLKETLNYFAQLFGQLSMPDDRVVHLYRRALYQSFSSFGMNRQGQVVGSNWGSYPATNRIWNKDMYYASLPFTMFEPELCQKTVLWFDQYGVKFPGSKFTGGINHSLSNSLSSALLASLYFEHTGDTKFFERYPQVLLNASRIIEDILAQRRSGEPMLFPSVWLSDAFALGKYHTGSNLCLWKACSGLAEIFEVLEQLSLSKRYKNIACKLKESICKQMTIDGTFGEQFLEGIGDEEKTTYSVKNYQKPILEQGLIFLSDVIVDGKINLLMHDGEESDTTLMPFYQFLDNKDHLYQNTMAFSASSFNPTYSEEIKGITWGLESGATFPGFITVLMSELHNPQAFVTRLEELICLADLDGSWWWWPYRLEAQQGEVVRDFGCGKCGWASGLFVSLMISQYFGLKFKKGVLQIDPVDNLTFSWKNLKFGQAFISIECTQSELSISNLSEKPLKISDTKKILHVEKGKTIHIQRRKR